MKKTNKYTYYYVLQANYGSGWDDVEFEDKSEPNALMRIRRLRKEYMNNPHGYGGLRIISRRELNKQGAE